MKSIPIKDEVPSTTPGSLRERVVGIRAADQQATAWRGVLQQTAGLVLAALLGMGLFASCEYSMTPESQAAGSIEVPLEGARGKTMGGLAAGDVISVAYPGAPELNVTQKVRANGKVSLPMVGDVTAGGKQLPAFQDELAGLYAKHLQDPKVVVAIEQTAAVIYVSGRVQTPGKIVLDRPMTVLEAVMEAGGYNDFAKGRVSVIRNENGTQKRYNLNLNEALASPTSPAFYVKPYDVIYVN